jgi:hypothetical protein
MYDKTFIYFIEKTVQTKSYKDAMDILKSTYYPYTDKKITRDEAEHFYYLYKRNEKDIKVNKDYLYNKTKQNYAARGY